MHGKDQAAAAASIDKDSTRPTDPPFNKDSRIAIVGGGPAGLTMAYQLQKRGYQKVSFALNSFDILVLPLQLQLDCLEL